MFVSNKCLYREHLDKETDPPIVDITTSLCPLLFHTIAIPFQVFVQLFIDAIVMNDTRWPNQSSMRLSILSSLSQLTIKLYAMIVMKHWE